MNFDDLPEAEKLRVFIEACKQVLSAEEFQLLEERAALFAKLREDDAARCIIWPHDIGGLQ
jgi:hypothetical protein